MASALEPQRSDCAIGSRVVRELSAIIEKLLQDGAFHVCSHLAELEHWLLKVELRKVLAKTDQ